MVPVRHRAVVIVHELRIGLSDVVAGGGGYEGRLVHPSSTPATSARERLAKLGQVLLDVVEGAEVDKRESPRRARLDLRDRPLPGVGVELRRGAGWKTKRPEPDPHACSVGVQRPSLSVRHVVPRVSGVGKQSSPTTRSPTTCTFSSGIRVCAHAEGVERVAVEASRARLELRRIDEVGRADLGDVNLQRRVLAYQHSSSACAQLVEVDVREEQMLHLGDVEPAFDEAGFEVGDRGRRAAVEGAGPSFVSRRYEPTMPGA